MTGQIQASIIIPTYNRVSCLFECMQAITVLEADPMAFEVIIVDNNSPDNTRDTVLSFAQSHQRLNIRYLCETKQGASYARNRGIMEAQGEIICFLDDDSPPYPNWLNNIINAFVDPAVGCVGGPSILDYRGQKRPPWLYGDLQAHLSAYSLPFIEPTQVSLWQHYPLSCNMALRKVVFTTLGLFRADLDRSGNQVLAAGDTEMAERVHKAGWKVLYLPRAQVRHIVAPERLEKSYIYRIGRGLAVSHIILTADFRLHKIARWFASDLWYTARTFFWFFIAIIRRDPLWFDDYMRFWIVGMRIPLRARALYIKIIQGYLYG